mmetsp:Transcript_106541/g.332269  ORF Transcript_106541/g.332269 Transcript_106541/m.332269 type:complete len:287 (+) Transcript_106541:80-940(+)
MRPAACLAAARGFRRPPSVLAPLAAAVQGWRQGRRLAAATGPPARPPPKRTDEGTLIIEGSPYGGSDRLVWGSVLWDAGLALAKFFAWNEAQPGGGPAASVRSQAVLELGAGTGVVGLTLCRLGAGRVTLTDCEPELLELLRRNARANGLCTEGVDVREVNWAEPATFLPASLFDVVVAADVLYSRKDRWLVRALEAHMGRHPGATAFVACPPRADSPLAGFFEMLLGLGLSVERLEDAEGRPVGSAVGPASAYAGSRFVALSEDRCPLAAADGPRRLQIFRVRRR